MPLLKPRLRTRWQGGTEKYHTVNSSLEPGPKTFLEFSEWPCGLCTNMFSASSLDCGYGDHRVRLARITDNLVHGFVLHTDYSGKQCPETLLRMMGTGLSEKLKEVGDLRAVTFRHRKWPWLVVWRACDNSKLCQQVILKGNHPPEHMLPDLLSRLPISVQDKLSTMRPQPTDPLPVRKAAFAEMETYLESVKRDAFGRNMLGPCLRHPGHSCPVAWRDPTGGNPTCRPLTCGFAGPVCLPWSPYGKQEGDGHMATEAWHIWIKDMQAQGFDYTFFENSSKCPKHIFAEPMAPSSHVVSFPVGPETLGWPSRRLRLMGCAIKRESLVWCGPTSDEEAAKVFKKFFLRRAAVDANVFAHVDDPAKIAEEREYRAKKAGATEDNLLDMSVEQYFKTEKQKRRACAYVALSKVRAGFVSGTMTADVTQNPKARLRAGPWMGTVTKSSDMVLLKAGDKFGYFFTQSELAASQGWPSIETATNVKFMAAMSYPLGTLSRAKQRNLQGNGMHLAAVASFVAFILAHTVRRDLVKEFLPPTRNLKRKYTDEAEDELDGSTGPRRR